LTWPDELPVTVDDLPPPLARRPQTVGEASPEVRQRAGNSQACEGQADNAGRPPRPPVLALTERHSHQVGHRDQRETRTEHGAQVSRAHPGLVPAVGAPRAWPPAAGRTLER